jgi:hypothetical protein
MKDQTKKGKQISRRGMIPILGSTLLIPLLGFGNTNNDETEVSKDEEYKTLLRADGTTVKVRTSILKKSKVVKENVSNKSLLKWLGKKL